MGALTAERFEHWLRTYGRAWETGDVHLVGRLFSDNARYFEVPFDEPMIGRNAIEKYWKEGAADAQTDVRFRFEIVSVVDSTGLALWQASFVRVPSGIAVDLDGFLLAEFDAAGTCSLFREWWHRQETPGDGDSG